MYRIDEVYNVDLFFSCKCGKIYMREKENRINKKQESNNFNGVLYKEGGAKREVLCVTINRHPKIR